MCQFIILSKAALINQKTPLRRFLIFTFIQPLILHEKFLPSEVDKSSEYIEQSAAPIKACATRTRALRDCLIVKLERDEDNTTTFTQLQGSDWDELWHAYKPQINPVRNSHVVF